MRQRQRRNSNSNSIEPPKSRMYQDGMEVGRHIASYLSIVDAESSIKPKVSHGRRGEEEFECKSNEFDVRHCYRCSEVIVSPERVGCNDNANRNSFSDLYLFEETKHGEEEEEEEEAGVCDDFLSFKRKEEVGDRDRCFPPETSFQSFVNVGLDGPLLDVHGDDGNYESACSLEYAGSGETVEQCSVPSNYSVLPETIESDDEESITPSNDLNQSQRQPLNSSKIIHIRCDSSPSALFEVGEMVLSASLPLRSYVQYVVENIDTSLTEGTDLDHEVTLNSRDRYNVPLCVECKHYFDSTSPESLREPDEMEAIVQEKRWRLVRGLERQFCPNPNSFKFGTKDLIHERAISARGIIGMVCKKVMENVPLSILLKLSEGTANIGIRTCVAVYKISSSMIRAGYSFVLWCLERIWREIVNFHPWTMVEIFFNMQKRAMGKTTEACQSASAAIHMIAGHASNGLSTRNGHFSSRSSIFSSFRNRPDPGRNINEKLLRKLNSVDAASRVVAYMEWDDSVLSQHVRAKVQRMMHYDVSLRPFVATVSVADQTSSLLPRSRPAARVYENVGLIDSSIHSGSSHMYEGCSIDSEGFSIDSGFESRASSSCVTNDSPFLCTPKSFPTTPSSRQLVMARSCRFSEDVVYLARDQLRVENGLSSKDQKTRGLAQSLRECRRLAVFNASDTSTGIVLTRGQHCATKVGNVLYCSTRSM